MAKPRILSSALSQTICGRAGSRPATSRRPSQRLHVTAYRDRTTRAQACAKPHAQAVGARGKGSRELRPRGRALKAEARTTWAANQECQTYVHAQEAQRRFNRLVEEELSVAGIRPASVDAAWTRVYARKLWRLLSRASASDPERVQRKLKQLEDRTTGIGIGSLPVLTVLRERITALS